jgi:hypothetical protein
MLATNAEGRSEDAMHHPFYALALVLQQLTTGQTATGLLPKVVTSLAPIAQKQTRHAL